MSEERRRRVACFGGSVAIHVGGSDGMRSATAAAERAEAQVLEMHARLSRFITASELSQLNDDPREVVPASALMRSFAAAAVAAGHRSQGLVDATRLGALERLGYRRSLKDARPLPLATTLAGAPRRAPAQPDPAQAWRTIGVDEADGTVTRPPGLRLDSGGIAKGLAADLVGAGLRAHPTYAVDCGGDVRLGGTARVARQILVDDPFGGPPLHEFELTDGAVATSGIGKRAWLRDDGAPAHHLLDPRTGEPAYTGIVQATALAPTAVVAEVLAKVAVLSGPGLAPARLPFGGVVVLEDRSVEVVAARLDPAEAIVA